MIERETRQARQAALLLHSLQPDARNAVLRQVEPAHAQRLELMLDELRKLGVPPALGDRLHHLVAPRDAGGGIATALDRAALLSGAEVERCLRSCAPSTVARLLAVRAWPWQADLLDLMPEARRVDVLEHMQRRTMTPAPALAAFLCERLVAEADAALAGEASVRGAADAARTGGRAARMLALVKGVAAWIR